MRFKYNKFFDRSYSLAEDERKPVNPLLSEDFLIPFDQIKPEHIDSGIRQALQQAQQDLEALIAFSGQRNYQNTLQALDNLTERLTRAVTIGYHLNAVSNSPELRQSFNAVLPEFSAFFARLPLNQGLWQAIKDFSQSSEAKHLQGVYKRHLERTLKDFIRSGADLAQDAKARVEAIKIELSQLQTKFSDQVLDATNAFEMLLTEADIAGLPKSLLQQAKATAESKGLRGYRIGLQAPYYVPFMQYSQRRDLRQKLYEAFMNRASSGALDNRPLMKKILALRQELSRLLGYPHFADYRLEMLMAKTGQRALAFERDLEQKTQPYWQRERALLLEYASSLGLSDLQPWDVSFVTEKLRQAQFDFDDETLRPYFPLEGVLSGMFEIAQKLFNIQIGQRENKKVWHPEVKFYDIHDHTGQHLASFYADWFPRESKRSGAWMNHFITGKFQPDGSFSPHLGLMCANFSLPTPDRPALLTHREVETTFHEFGHLLHHCLSKVQVSDRAGTNVAWDFVELPSQIMENWTWERQALNLFARHYQTQDPIPEDLFQKMQNAKTFMQALTQMRQLGFGTVDLEMHINYDPGKDGDLIAYGNQIAERFTIHPEFSHNNSLASFTHVFSGGYAAGYYSYKWSEVLEADAFTRFKREGIFNPKTGQDYLDTILSQGDSDDPEVLFRNFMGRDPDAGALIVRNLGKLEN
jgi:oligopeptidase A